MLVFNYYILNLHACYVPESNIIIPMSVWRQRSASRDSAHISRTWDKPILKERD